MPPFLAFHSIINAKAVPRKKANFARFSGVFSRFSVKSLTIGVVNADTAMKFQLFSSHLAFESKKKIL